MSSNTYDCTVLQIDAKRDPATLLNAFNYAIRYKIKVIIVHRPWLIYHPSFDRNWLRVTYEKYDFVYCNMTLEGSDTLILLKKIHNQELPKRVGTYHTTSLTIELKLLQYKNPMMIAIITSSADCRMPPDKAANEIDRVVRYYDYKMPLIYFVLDATKTIKPTADSIAHIVSLNDQPDLPEFLVYANTKMNALCRHPTKIDRIPFDNKNNYGCLTTIYVPKIEE